jgi:putative endonuclease
MSYQKRIGRSGEQIAAAFLQEKGYQILDENYTSRYGELDLVVMDLDMVVFVEVKTRTSTRFGLPEESISPEKLERIHKAGLVWLQDHPAAPDDWRIDAIAIRLDRHQTIQDIQHFINIS